MVHTSISPIFDLIFFPFKALDPVVGLCAVSLLTAMIVLPIFKYTSNQEGIKKTKTRMIGHLLEVRLFKDNIRIILLAQKNIIKLNMVYLMLVLKPLLFVIIPVTIVMIQTGLRYEKRPLRPGETVIVKVVFDTPNNLFGKKAKGRLIPPEGLKIETPPLRVDGGKEVYWRIKAEKEGVFYMRLQIPNIEIKKKIVVSDKIVRLSTKVLKKGLINSFFYPGEPLSDEDLGVEFFEVKYPSRKVLFFGWEIHWLIIFFILTFGFGLLLLKPFKVSI